jgi:hypothetical protein
MNASSAILVLPAEAGVAVGITEPRRRQLMTSRSTFVALLAALVFSAGCPSQQQQLAARQEGAVQTALQRGRFDLNCPAATATVLSRDYIQPAVQGPWVNGLERVEYTVGVAGCNQRTTYVVICQIGTDTCFAANPDARFRSQ